MTQVQKLEALVKQAVEGGFDSHAAASWIMKLITDDPEECRRFSPMLIFNHDFARALFGDKNVHSDNGYAIYGSCDGDCYSMAHFDGPRFEYYLMHAVISEDPIDYMYEVVFGKEA